MMTEDVTRFEVLLENIQTSVKVIAERYGAWTERLDRMDGRFDVLAALAERGCRGEPAVAGGRRVAGEVTAAARLLRPCYLAAGAGAISPPPGNCSA